MRRFKIHPEETLFYYSTCTIVYWIPVFQEETYFRILIDSLKYCVNYKGLILHGYVIMPTHIHLITSNATDTTLSDIMRDFKHYTSSEIIRALKDDHKTHWLSLFSQAAEHRSVHQKYKVWQDEYHPIGLKSEKWFLQKLQYMHENPVRKGFVERPEDWKYSSARNWLNDDHSIIEIVTLDSAFSYGAEAP